HRLQELRYLAVGHRAAQAIADGSADRSLECRAVVERADGPFGLIISSTRTEVDVITDCHIEVRAFRGGRPPDIRDVDAVPPPPQARVVEILARRDYRLVAAVVLVIHR